MIRPTLIEQEKTQIFAKSSEFLRVGITYLIKIHTEHVKCLSASSYVAIAYVALNNWYKTRLKRL
jgi:hypothetical protein